jgi:hypothetical protein
MEKNSEAVSNTHGQSVTTNSNNNSHFPHPNNDKSAERKYGATTAHASSCSKPTPDTPKKDEGRLRSTKDKLRFIGELATSLTKENCEEN